MYRKIIVPAIIFLMSIVIACSTGKNEEHAIISFMIGDVKKNGMDTQIGDVIKKEDVLKTLADSFCDIKIGESLIRIKANSNVVISSLLDSVGNEDTVLGLMNGRMLCKPKKLLKSEKFMIKTPTAVAGIRGTQFSVEADKLKTTRIKVFSGKVKVAKRVKQLESKVHEVVEIAPTLNKEEKIIITAKDVKKAEKAVENSLKRETAKGNSQEDVLAKVISLNKSNIIVQRKDVRKFAASEFIKENKEIIQVEEKPKKIIVRIKKVIKKTIEEPKPEGRLLVTRYDVYYIKDGKIKWEGKLLSAPVRIGKKLYVASEDYIFCADDDGPVMWRKNIINDGKIKVENGQVKLKAGTMDILLDARTGNKM